MGCPDGSLILTRMLLLLSEVTVASESDRKSIDSSYVILPEIVIRSLAEDDESSFALSELCQVVP